MPTSDNTLVLTNLSPDSRSISPMTPSPCREIRGIKLFKAISKRLSRRSNEDLNYQEENDCNSSSSDSCSSSFGRVSRRKEAASADSGFRSISPNHMSSSSSEAGSDIQSRNRHHHSTSAESIRKVFQNLNVRSQSCSNTKDKRKTKKPITKILRQPVTYTYVKGLSGLPTQRIPRNSKMFQSCGCSMYYTPGR
ncbi:uncharacterized protein LOC130448781 [Diorhabda sublineata]|uniref:uncharacterized protein LOC130448781 n=1 Tax=Diorhabda sublineata TaxID=1163346 RepID=UPI0024E0FA0C|nr:uncharacterized protein LOC130448781 [Diorhabda sublineata]